MLYYDINRNLCLDWRHWQWDAWKIGNKTAIITTVLKTLAKNYNYDSNYSADSLLNNYLNYCSCCCHHTFHSSSKLAQRKCTIFAFTLDLQVFKIRIMNIFTKASGLFILLLVSSILVSRLNLNHVDLATTIIIY